MIECPSAARARRTRWARGGPADGPDGGFITGSDFLMDGGVTASYWYGERGRGPWPVVVGSAEHVCIVCATKATRSRCTT